ncbi:MAG: butyrate kinase [Bacteroidota bacterium]|nr:butyrate kinase [Bacteroidota bacterium]
METFGILVINPGSTSTKIAVFENAQQIFLKCISHSIENLKSFNGILEQLEYRKSIIIKELNLSGIELLKINIIIGRGGLLKPIESGVYRVNERMKEDLKNEFNGSHASNLGGLIADELTHLIPHTQAFIADPIVVDEMQDVARITGHPLFTRKSIFHALNQKAVARFYAQSIHRRYEDLNLIVAHLGGGITIGTHHKGRVIDVNQGLDGEGPMSPERSGTLPIGDVINTCFSGKYDYPALKKMVSGEGGYIAWLGTNDARKVSIMAENKNKKALLIQEALCYQVSKYIGASAAVLEGKIDAILLTGGLAYNKKITDYITKHVSFISKVLVFPGEYEMEALAMNALMVLKNELKPKEYN